MTECKEQKYEVKPALCLDLDGTVRYSKSSKFIEKLEDIALFDGVQEKIWQYRDKGYLIFGVSNQAGVAYEYKTPSDDINECSTTVGLFERGNPFHAIMTCYHHEKGTLEPYNHRSLLRKPDIGMLVMCEKEAFEMGYIIDWDNSLFVGDRPEDEQCAQNGGIAFQWAESFRSRRPLITISGCTISF